MHAGNLSSSTIAVLLTLVSATLAKKASSLPPSLPAGATLVQFAPCSGIAASIPLFVNDQYTKGSKASSVVIGQHGASRNASEYFTSLYKVIGKEAIIAAPNFHVPADAGKENWFDPVKNLAWEAGIGLWTAGSDAIAPVNALQKGACSSYDVYDALLHYFSNKALFPNIKNVYLIGHSGGANMISRISQIHDDSGYPFRIRYIIANAANQAYFTSARPVKSGPTCEENSRYPYQWVREGMNRYVSNKFEKTNALNLYQRWTQRDVVFMVGALDTFARANGQGTQDCASQMQGGQDRRDRGSAYWTYDNILAGRGAKVLLWKCYNQLVASGAKLLGVVGVKSFNHQFCLIKNADHDQDLMFGSECARRVLRGSQVP